MRALGWEPGKLRFGGSGPERCYAKGDPKTRLPALRVVRDEHGAVKRVKETGLPMVTVDAEPVTLEELPF